MGNISRDAMIAQKSKLDINEAVAQQADGKPLGGYEWRMNVELRELSTRIGKLSDFLGSTPWINLPPIDQDLLYAQHDAMCAYRRILAIRLARASVPEVKPVDTVGEILDDGIRLAKPDPTEPLPFNG
jgi:hypothetical protein